MQRKPWMGWTLAALLAVTTACQDEHVGPVAGAQELSPQEAADVAELTADAVDAILDRELAANPLVASGGDRISFSAAPITTTYSWTRERECRNGGTVSASGEGTRVADRATGEVTIDFSGSKTITDCARARGDLVVTINGQGTFQGHREKLNGRFVGLQTNDAEGSFSWVTSDGRGGSCEYRLHTEWDPSTHTKTITGFVCDKEINRTVTRDGSAGSDRRSSSA